MSGLRNYRLGMARQPARVLTRQRTRVQARRLAPVVACQLARVRARHLARVLTGRPAWDQAWMLAWALALTMATAPVASAQGPLSPRESAPVDLTGYWVSVVTEDWRWRMVVPGKGDYASIPLNEVGKRVADVWEPGTEAAGAECRPYGAAAIMRVPGRIHVTWEDDDTLRIDTDAGMQTRLFHFDGEPPEDMERTWQGYSSARWELPPGGRSQLRVVTPLGVAGSGGNRSQWRSLEVVTTNLRSGYLRWNGVPYSADAVVREYYDVTPMPNGDTWLIVTTIVEDPLYLDIPYVTSANFKKQADDSGWNPTPCATG